MWLAELLGRERGEEVQLGNNPSTHWVCNPHVEVNCPVVVPRALLIIGMQVPFQPNAYDCGVHTLWHLQHVLHFRQVQGERCLSNVLRFSENMVGKRLRLAQEMLDDCHL